MNKQYNVLVTGIGAVIGYGVIKSLTKNCYVVGSDIYSDAVGQHWVDKFVQAPYTSSPEYMGWLKNVISENKIDIVFPGIEQDVHFISANIEELSDLSCKFVINKQYLIDVTKDKLKTYNYLKEKFPENVILSIDKIDWDYITDNVKLPFLLKPKCSYASKGIVKINTKDEFDFYTKHEPQRFIAQPIIGDNDNEYTVATFGYGDGKCGPIIAFRRKLSQEGATAKAVTYFDESLEKLIKKMCEYIKPLGPTNFQFRKIDECYKLLEINPRISSSTSLRKAFGYNEAEMCIDYFLNNSKTVIEKTNIKKGAAQRYIEDYITYDSDNI